eukprot:NODE_126_length_18761_cov_0.476262.p8 type:complete len:174 gc:universal NODE_126_length_18761_cov_0.476262:2339-2860(+)
MVGLQSVGAILAYNVNGQPLFLKKYFTEGPTDIYPKIKSNLSAELIIVENKLVIFKQINDVVICLVAFSDDQNEMQLYEVLINLVEAISLALGKHQLDQLAVSEYYDFIAITINEMIFEGIVMETDPHTIAARVSKRPSQAVSELSEIRTGEQSISQAFTRAKESFFEKYLLK